MRIELSMEIQMDPTYSSPPTHQEVVDWYNSYVREDIERDQFRGTSFYNEIIWRDKVYDYPVGCLKMSSRLVVIDKGNDVVRKYELEYSDNLDDTQNWVEMSILENIDNDAVYYSFLPVLYNSAIIPIETPGFTGPELSLTATSWKYYGMIDESELPNKGVCEDVSKLLKSYGSVFAETSWYDHWGKEGDTFVLIDFA